MKMRIFSAEVTIRRSSKGPPRLRGSIVLGGTTPNDGARRLFQSVLASFDQEAAAPPAPAPLPRSRREVLEQRDQRQEGLQQNLRNALAIDTIGAFYDDNGTGEIRRLEGTGDPTRPPCPSCKIRPAVPMTRTDAEYVRATFRRARMPQPMAYAFATTRVILTQKNQARLCECDRLAWQRAIDEFGRLGRTAWRRFGLSP